jgi:hypothetical protein
MQRPQGTLCLGVSKKVNPYKKHEIDNRTPEDLLNIIEAKGEKNSKLLRALRE